MKTELELIKKKYGEEMFHLCRELFPTILEEDGLLIKLLLNSFYPNKFLYEDIIREKQISIFKCKRTYL